MLLLCLLLLTALFTHAQKGAWNFSVSGGFGWGGPKTTFKKAMIETRFDQTQSGWLGTSKHPRVHPAFSLLAKVGKGVKENTAFFVAGGVTGAGSVDGYNQQEYGGSGWLSPSSARVSVEYKVMQLTAGLEHTLRNSNVIIGYGPSVYILKYTNATYASEKYQSVVAGLNLSCAIPLFRIGSPFGVALVTDMNLALPAQLKPLHHYYTKDGAPAQVAFVHEGKANMTQGMIGLALMFRS